MIQHISIELNKQAYDSFFSMFVFILRAIIVNTINIGTVIMIIVLELLQVKILHGHSFFVPIFISLVYILIALEETYHIIMIIHLNKKGSISCIDITRVNILFFCCVGGVCVCYNGKFKKSDIFFISIAGPIMPLMFLFSSCVVLYIIHLVLRIDITFVLRIIMISTIAPLSALIPIWRTDYYSDGYQIISFVKKNRVPLRRVLSSIKFTIKTMLCMTIRFSN